jgi:hypothetical protein
MDFGAPPQASRKPAILISIAVLAAITVALFLLNPHKTAEASVTKTQLFSAHTETAAAKGASGFHVIGPTGEVQDNLYVFVTVSVTDKLRLPIFISDISTQVLVNGGSQVPVEVLSPAEVANLYLSFPDAKAYDAPQLPRDTAIAPGETASGIVVLHIGGATAATWRARKSAKITLTLAHQSPITLTVPFA